MEAVARLRAQGPDFPQDARRAAEHTVKKRALAFSRWLEARQRHAPPERPRFHAADLLGLGCANLNHWRREWREGRRDARERGRPPARAAGLIRAQAHELLDQLGPSTSVATLMALVPGLGRNEARDLLDEWRQRCRDGHYATVNALQWRRPGAVWAMDHTSPPGAIDGMFPVVLLVRDLASHYQVAALPQAAPTDRAVAAALADLFTRHGAPLVLKSDNHGAFTGRETQQVLERWGVLPLLSPEYLPRYNGAIEAGAGQFKTRAHEEATRRDRPGRWSCDDVEGARVKANRTLRPWGPDGPTPEERWDRRMPATGEERDSLRRAYGARLAENEINPPLDDWRKVNIAVQQVVRKADTPVGLAADAPAAGPQPLAPWAQVWNTSPSPGHRRPWEKTADPSASLSANISQPNVMDRGKTPVADRPGGPLPENYPGKTSGQSRMNALYSKWLNRRSLTDVLVAAGLLLIRKRRIPLPI